MNKAVKDAMSENAVETPVQAVSEAVSETVTELYQDYGDEPQPFGGYWVLIVIYQILLGGLLYAAKKRNALPERVNWNDMILLGIATHKVTRLTSKSKSTSALRAPFTRFEKSSEVPGEVCEEARGEGVQQTVGELLTCPFCLGTWLATIFTGGLFLAPRVTRGAGSVFAVLAISDALHHLYVALSNKSS